jgi:3D (Asp-Asp-Asp) domain-containing protein
MDRNTAAALGQNLSSAFADIGQIFDPRMRAAADQQRLTNEGLTLRNTGQGIENQYLPKQLQANLGLTGAQANSANAAAGNYNASAGFTNTRTSGLTNLNRLAGSLSIPTTSYSTGADVGGPDEMQDSWTNRGYTATGKNLSPGVVAVNPSVYPHGTVFKDPNTGEIMIAADTHGNKNPNVVDIFKDPSEYRSQNDTRNLQVVGNEDIPYGTTKEQLAALRQKYMDQQQAAPLNMNQAAIYAAIANGGGDPSQLMNAFAKTKAMGATDELTARQALAGQGVIANQGEYFLPQESTAFQNRGLTSAFNINEADNESNRLIASGNAQTKLIGDMFGGASGSGDGSTLRVPKTAPNSFTEMNKVSEEAQAASFKTFGVPVDEAGAPTEDPYAPTRKLWSQSYANARQTGMSPIEAEAAANVHHFGTDQPAINSEDTFRFGFGKDPSIPAITNTEPLQPSPELGVNPNQMGAVIESIPSLFGMQVQAPGIANAGVPVTGAEQPAQQNAVPPMLQRPAEQPTKIGRASDEFGMKEWTNEGVAIKEKQQKIADLERIIKSSTKALRDGYVEFQGSAESPPGLTELNDKSKRKMLDSLRKAENDLEKLRGGSDQSGQGRQVGRFLVE